MNEARHDGGRGMCRKIKMPSPPPAATQHLNESSERGHGGRKETQLSFHHHTRRSALPQNHISAVQDQAEALAHSAQNHQDHFKLKALIYKALF